MQPTAYWVTGTPLSGIKQPGHEAGHAPPSTAAVKNTWNYTSMVYTGTTLLLPSLTGSPL